MTTKNFWWMLMGAPWLAALLTTAAAAQQTVSVPPQVVSYADMVVYNGKVMTMDDRSIQPDPGTIAQAMAIRNGKILAVGTNDQILLYAGPKTRRIDVHGRTVIPGIIDSHIHIHNYATAFYMEKHPEAVESVARQFTLQGKTYAELKRGIEVILKENMANAKPGQWAYISLPNGGSSGTGLGVKFLQTEQVTGPELDKLSPNNPVLIMSHPAYMTNEAGRRSIGEIYHADPDDVIAVDKNGFGDLTEYSRSLIVDSYFKDKTGLLADVVRGELERNAALGITTYSSHITGLRFMDAFMKLIRDHNMPIRFGWSDYFGFEGNPDPASFYLRLGDMAGWGTDYFWQTGVGLSNIDSGPPMFCSTMEGPPAVKQREWCRNKPGTAFEQGIYSLIVAHERLAVGHAYADRGVDYIFQTIQRAMKNNPSITLDYIRSRHFSSDHCGFYPRPDQIPIMKKYGWMMSCSGAIVERSAPWLKSYGMNYGKWISPVRSLIQAGVRTVFENEASWRAGEDRPITYLSSAMFLLTRKDEEGQVIAPKEAIDRVTLMKMMTCWPSDFVLKPKELGTLEAGKWADFEVLNKDYFTVPLEEIAHVYPIMTVVGGKPIFIRSGFAAEQGTPPVGPQIKYINLPPGDPAAAPAKGTESASTPNAKG